MQHIHVCGFFFNSLNYKIKFELLCFVGLKKTQIDLEIQADHFFPNLNRNGHISIK